MNFRLICALIIVPCGATAQEAKSPKIPDIVFVAGDDKQMNEAMATAQKSIDAFIKAWKKRSAAQSEFAIKIAIKEGEKIEHFWIAITKFDGKAFIGNIANEPGLVKNVKEGDEVSAAKGKVEDWMYVEKRKLVGGYTTRLLRKRLSAEERKALDASIDYKID